MIKKVFTKENIAGVVVLYNYSEETIININSYIDQVDFLFLVDNSDSLDTASYQLFSNNKKIEYIFNKKNVGVAAALNIGAAKAIEKNYSFLLTMDQDSSAANDMIDIMINSVENFDNIGIISPFHVNKYNTKPIPSEKYLDEFVVQTSGNLLNLSIYQKIGTFRDDFFIDYVDTEYCLRLKKNNYKVLRISKALLFHNEANISIVKIFGYSIYPHNHSAQRMYYKTRNRFYLSKMYKNTFPEYFKHELALFINMFIKIILFEKNKLKKIKYSLKGYIDYLNKRKFSLYS